MSENPSPEQGGTVSKWNLVQFALMCSYTVGTSGATSFPYYIYTHTGLFFIAYYVLIVLVCIPVCYVQLKLGAIYQRGIVGIFSHLIPILKGAAIALLLLTYVRCILFALELSYTLYFAFVSFQKPFPWSYTRNRNFSQYLPRIYNLAEDKYFHEDFLQLSSHVGESGTILWYVLLTLLTTWVATYFLTYRGPSGLGKIVYVLTPLTVMIMILVLIYGYVVNDHATETVWKLLGYEVAGFSSQKPVPDVSETNGMLTGPLSSPAPWIDAFNLHLTSIGLWAGVLPTLGAQLNNKKFVINAGWMILLSVYSLLPQIVLYAIAPYIDLHHVNTGFVSAQRGMKPGLSFLFISIPTTFDKYNLSPFIAFCLYMSIFLFGLHHQALHLSTIWENLLPSTPKIVMTYLRKREYLIALVCAISLLLSIPYAMQCGMHLYQVINSYIDRLIFTLIIISMVPLITGYIKQDILYLPIERACMSIWFGLASLISAALLIYYFAVHVYPHAIVGHDQAWAEHLGWFVASGLIIVGVTIGAVHAVYKEKGSFKERLIHALKSDAVPSVENSNDYESADTGETGLHGHRAKSPVSDKKMETQIERPTKETELKEPREMEVLIKLPNGTNNVSEV
ncbi:hypothetical protein ScPMuIL_005566 [Solemya velum]